MGSILLMHSSIRLHATESWCRHVSAVLNRRQDRPSGLPDVPKPGLVYTGLSGTAEGHYAPTIRRTPGSQGSGAVISKWSRLILDVGDKA